MAETTTYPEAILAMCSKTPKAVLHCPGCKKVASSCRRYSAKAFTWAVVLYCECSIQWIVCSTCENQRAVIRNAVQRRYHEWNKHARAKSPPSKKKREEKQTEPLDKSDGDDSSENAKRRPSKKARVDGDSSEHSHDDGKETAGIDDDPADDFVSCHEDDKAVAEKNTNNSLSVSFSTDFVGTPQSASYFQAEHREDHGGLREIVCKSQFRLTTMASDISMTDVNYVTELAHFSHDLSRGQREHLAKVLKLTVEKVKRDEKIQMSKKKKRPWNCVIPTSYLEIRRQYTGYPESFLNQLPCPMVGNVGPFAYSSLRDCIQNFLAHGYDISKATEASDATLLEKVTHITESAHCRRRQAEINAMYSTPVTVLWILEWSDGYDPHGFSKTNRGSAWVKVISFVPPPSMNNSVLYTYPVALGPATGDHDLVEEKFGKELLELSDPSHVSGNRFYSGQKKDFVTVHVELVVSLMDQPERRSALHLIRGNSTLGARWCYVASLTTMKDSLVPCDDCAARLFKNDPLWDELPCTKCTQWNMDREDDKLAWDPSPDFPCGAMEHVKEKHYPKKITFDMLKNAISTAGEMLTAGTWTKAQAEVYLADFCIGNKMIAEIVRKSENIRILKEVEIAKLEKPDQYDVFKELVLENPDDFCPVKCPPLWQRGVKIHQHIDVVMHLVFLGAVSGTLSFIHTWLKQHNKYASFMRVAEQRLAGVKKLNLNWLKAMLYKGEKLGGWVSENYLGFSRVCKWFFLVLDNLADDEPEFVQPSIPQVKWTAKQNRGWLKARALDILGKAAELKKRVQDFMTQESGPPQLQEPPGGTVDEVFDLISAMSDMVGRVMVTSCGQKEVYMVDMAVKKFLTRFALLDKKVNKNKKKVTTQWIASYTFPCLLNLADTMKEFGPLKNYWEGGVRGEGILRYMKPQHGTIMMRVGWPKLVLERVHRKKSLTCISGGTTGKDDEEEYMEEDDNDLTNDHSYETREFFKYPTDSAMVEDYMDSQPLSVVRTSCGKYGMVTRNDQMLLLARKAGTSGIVLRDITFIHWSIHSLKEDGTEELLVIPLNTVTISYAFVMLPHPTLKNWYCAVRSDWKEMNDLEEFA